MGYGITKAFKQSVLSNAEDALQNQVVLLMTNIDVEGSKIIVPSILSEGRLSQSDSDLFAQITTPSQGVVWQSESLLERSLPKLDEKLGQFQFYSDIKWQNQLPIYAMSFGAVWETDNGDLPFTVQVAEHRVAYQKRLVRYQRQVLIWLFVLGVSVLILLYWLLSWALKPLVRVSTQVAEIEQGARQQFDEDYPREVNQLTQSLNQLLSFEKQRISKQKEVLGNLAHSLKTPIAVLSGLKYSKQNKKEAERQLAAMQNIIDYQLQSASAVGRQRFAKPISVRQLTQQLISSLEKLNRHKNINALIHIGQNVVFYGDQGDWMELVGNLLDNAFKWAKTSVEIRVSNVEVKSQLGSARAAINIRISDDGSGIDDQQKLTILKRGVRLDQQTPGHGLGLHIVNGIVDAYDGNISIKDNSPQGTIFEVVLN